MTKNKLDAVRGLYTALGMKNYVDYEDPADDAREVDIATRWIAGTFAGIAALLWAFWP